MKLQSSHNEFQGPVQLSHRSQKISPSKWPAAGILGPDLVLTKIQTILGNKSDATRSSP